MKDVDEYVEMIKIAMKLSTNETRIDIINKVFSKIIVALTIEINTILKEYEVVKAIDLHSTIVGQNNKWKEILSRLELDLYDGLFYKYLFQLSPEFEKLISSMKE